MALITHEKVDVVTITVALDDRVHISYFDMDIGPGDRFLAADIPGSRFKLQFRLKDLTPPPGSMTVFGYPMNGNCKEEPVWDPDTAALLFNVDVNHNSQWGIVIRDVHRANPRFGDPMLIIRKKGS